MLSYGPRNKIIPTKMAGLLAWDSAMYKDDKRRWSRTFSLEPRLLKLDSKA